MAHTDHHAPQFRTDAPRNRTIRHSRGVSLAGRGAGAHSYRDENGRGERVTLRRRARRVGRHAFRAEVADLIG